MDNEVRTLLKEYLAGQKTIDDVRNWVALDIWDAPPSADTIADHLAIELSHLDRGIVDERYFRVQVLDFLGIVRSEQGDAESAGRIRTSMTNTLLSDQIHVD